jgi:sugar-specific transcriptional regulator TrmB
LKIAEKAARKKMNLFPSELAMVLEELGLTLSEVRVYLVLVQMGSTQTGPISKTAGIHRQHVYHTLNSLEEKGLIEKQLGTTTQYTGIPIDKVLSMLIKRKQKQMSDLKTKSQMIIDKLKRERGPQPLPLQESVQEESKFKIIPGREILVQRLKEAIGKSSISVEVITSPVRFSTAIHDFAKHYRKALKRGVIIRIATEKHAVEKKALEIVRNLAMNPNFEVKHFSEPTDAIITIFDNNEAFVSLSATAHLDKASGIWSNNASFIAIAQNYFKTKWDNSYLL